MKHIILQSKRTSLGAFLLSIVFVMAGCDGPSKPSGTTTDALAAPLITTQPKSQIITEGNTATLSVSATHPSGATLSYQWQKKAKDSTDFKDIAGATSESYTTPTLRAADSGVQYKVVVTATNTAGLTSNATSDIAILSVLHAKIVWTNSKGEKQYSKAPLDGVLTSRLLTGDKNDIKSVDTIPSVVTAIGHSGFSLCSNLISINIPSSVTRIEPYAFYFCTSLPSINIPSSVTSIEFQTFATCSKLATVTLPNGFISIGSDAFNNCPALSSITIPETVTSIGDRAFSGCSAITSIEIPSKVTSIGSGLFSNCSSLASITIPDGVTSIGQSAFLNCTSLTSITIPSKVTSIERTTFENCKSMRNVTIPNGVTSIDIAAFKACEEFTSIVIPSSVASIGQSAFEGCTKLTSVRVEAAAPPTVKTPTSIFYSGMFKDTPTTLKITVPPTSGDAYKAATNWMEYANQISEY